MNTPALKQKITPKLYCCYFENGELSFFGTNGEEGLREPLDLLSDLELPHYELQVETEFATTEDAQAYEKQLTDIVSAAIEFAPQDSLLGSLGATKAVQLMIVRGGPNEDAPDELEICAVLEVNKADVSPEFFAVAPVQTVDVSVFFRAHTLLSAWEEEYLQIADRLSTSLCWDMMFVWPGLGEQNRVERFLAIYLAVLRALMTTSPYARAMAEHYQFIARERAAALSTQPITPLQEL